jgi:hypothetical protein
MEPINHSFITPSSLKIQPAKDLKQHISYWEKYLGQLSQYVTATPCLIQDKKEYLGRPILDKSKKIHYDKSLTMGDISSELIDVKNHIKFLNYQLQIAA